MGLRPACAESSSLSFLFGWARRTFCRGHKRRPSNRLTLLSILPQLLRTCIFRSLRLLRANDDCHFQFERNKRLTVGGRAHPGWSKTAFIRCTAHSVGAWGAENSATTRLMTAQKVFARKLPATHSLSPLVDSTVEAQGPTRAYIIRPKTSVFFNND